MRGRGGSQGAACMRALASARRRQIPLVPHCRGVQCARVARTTTFPPASHRHRPSAADRMDWASVESSRNRTGRVLLLITSSSPPIPTPASAPTQLLAGLARQQDEYPTQRPIRELRWWQIPSWIPRRRVGLTGALVGGLPIGVSVFLITLLSIAFQIRVGRRRRQHGLQ